MKMSFMVALFVITGACTAEEFATSPTLPDSEGTCPTCTCKDTTTQLAPDTTNVESLATSKCVAACNNYAPCVAKCNQTELNLQPVEPVCPKWAPETLRFGNGQTLLHLAATQQDFLVLSDCMYPVLINTADAYGRTPLHMAAAYGIWNNIRILLFAHADYYATDNGGATSLHYAAQSGVTSAARELLESRKPEERTWALTVKDQFGFTPLFHAVFAQQPEMIDYLIAEGADVTAVSNRQFSAVDYVAQNPLVDSSKASKMLVSLCYAWTKTKEPSPASCADVEYVVRDDCYVDILKECDYDATCYQQNMTRCKLVITK
jgi:hypothetical protein